MTRVQWFMALMDGALAVFMTWDILQRKIPIPVVGSAMGMMAIFLYATQVPVNGLMMVSGAALGFLGAWVVGLPGGDRLALLFIGSMVGPVQITMISIVCYLVLWAIVMTYGQRHSLIEVPFFPVIAITTSVMMAVAPPAF